MYSRNLFFLSLVIGLSTALAMNHNQMYDGYLHIVLASILGSQLLELDLPNSTILSYLLFPISDFFYDHFGHAGFIHSPLFVGIAGFIAYWFLPFPVLFAFIAGMIMNLVAYFFTKIGVPFFYPIIKTRYSFWDKKAGSFGEFFVAMAIGVFYMFVLEVFFPFLDILVNEIHYLL